MITIRVLSIKDYDGIYNMWLNTPEMDFGRKLDLQAGMIWFIGIRIFMNLSQSIPHHYRRQMHFNL